MCLTNLSSVRASLLRNAQNIKTDADIVLMPKLNMNEVVVGSPFAVFDNFYIGSPLLVELVSSAGSGPVRGDPR